MKKGSLILILIFYSFQVFSQRLLVSWSQQNIENYTKEMYDDAQKLKASELLIKNLNDKSWSSVFLTLNASVNHYKKDTSYLTGLAEQISNNTETTLEGTSRLIIWDRIISGDILFEGKGIVIDNDLYKVGGRANQLLQNLTGKNFGFVNIHSSERELKDLKQKWIKFLSNEPVEEYIPIPYKNAKIIEISSLTALHALIISLQNNSKKEQLIKNCLKTVYNLDEMPKEKGSSASYCDPDTYTFSYLGLLFGDKKFDESKDAKWWKNFWESNRDKLVWNGDNGFYVIGK
jgi:hypothetical protein